MRKSSFDQKKSPLESDFEAAFKAGPTAFAELVKYETDHYRNGSPSRMALKFIDDGIKKYITNGMLQNAEVSLAVFINSSRVDLIEKGEAFNAVIRNGLLISNAYLNEGDKFAAISNAAITYEFSQMCTKPCAESYKALKDIRDKAFKEKDCEVADFAAKTLYELSPKHSEQRQNAIHYLMKRSQTAITEKEKLPPALAVILKNFTDDKVEKKSPSNDAPGV